ncbi:MAG: DUF6259 domain-containing protein [Candidatus Sumerlaeota bacterium]|nr:DUF6259 domain-containing protein [Candidatus Sumerlaeota bacterium]
MIIKFPNHSHTFEIDLMCGSLLRAIYDPDGGNWLDEDAGETGLWQIRFRGPDGTAPAMRPANGYFIDAQPLAADDDASGYVFRWRLTLTKRDECEVRVIVRSADAHSLSLWNLEIALPPGWFVTSVDFPVLANIRLRPGLKAAVPSGWGLEYDAAPGFEYEGHYPSCLAVMQFVAFYPVSEYAIRTGGNGLYIGAHDPNACLKTFGIKVSAKAARFSVTHPAPLADPGGLFRLPFDTAIGCFAGGWHGAARLYRPFTFTTPWGGAEAAGRRAAPRWLSGADLWLRPDGSAADNLEVTKRALEYFDCPTALHWYRWHVIPYDTHYPEYLPALPGIAGAIAELRGIGASVMPYINGRLWDPASASWSAEDAAGSAVRQENGEAYTEIYGSKVSNNVMCPFTRQWQRKVADVARDVARELGVDGIYIDQIGAAPGVACHNAAHGHPPGGGSFWHEGYRALLDTVRREHDAEFALTTEENAECWLDQFDGLLVVNTPTDGEPIPLFPAVYSGRALTIGFQYFPPDDIERSLPFRLKMARCFLWGAQLGWIQPARIMAPGAAREARYLRNLAHTRRHARRYFLSGHFLGVADVRGGNSIVSGRASGAFGGSYMISVPPVLGSVWESRDGSVALMMVNHTDEPHAVVVQAPDIRSASTPSGAMAASHGARLCAALHTHEGFIKNINVDPLAIRLDVPAAEAIMLEFADDAGEHGRTRTTTDEERGGGLRMFFHA